MRHYGYRCFRKSCKFKIVKFYLDRIKIIFVALIILISQYVVIKLGTLLLIFISKKTKLLTLKFLLQRDNNYPVVKCR